MSKLWPMVPLGDVLTERKETPFSVDIESGNIRILSKIGFNGGNIELRSGFETKTGMILVRPGDFVVSGINATKGAIAIYGEENTEPIAATIHYGAYIPNKNRVDTRFLWWLLRSRTFRDILTEYVPGGIKTELKAKRLLPIPVPLPPLSEQKQITTRLEELAAKVEEARGLRKQATEEAEALRHASLKDIIKNGLSNGWEMKPISEIAETNPSRQAISAFPNDMQVSFVPMVVVDDVTGTIKKTEIRQLGEVKKGYTYFAEGDVIFARITPCMQNGKSAIAKGLQNGIGFGSTEFHVMRPNINLLLPEWLHAIVRHKDFKDDATAHFKGTAGQQRVPQSFLVEKAIPVPPLHEQRRIVAYLDGLQAKADALKRLQSETASELNAMLPSVLDRAFKGGLTLSKTD